MARAEGKSIAVAIGGCGYYVLCGERVVEWGKKEKGGGAIGLDQQKKKGGR